MNTPQALQQFMEEVTPISGKWSQISWAMSVPILDEVIRRLVSCHKPLASHYTIANHQLYGRAVTTDTDSTDFYDLPPVLTRTWPLWVEHGGGSRCIESVLVRSLSLLLGIQYD